MSAVLSFSQKVWQLTAQIPSGRVSTYGQLALALGQPKASRAVGNALNKNPKAPQVPCHRVVRVGGQLGGYALGSPAKAKILRQEGIRIVNNKVANFEKVLYSNFLI